MVTALQQRCLTTTLLIDIFVPKVQRVSILPEALTKPPRYSPRACASLSTSLADRDKLDPARALVECNRCIHVRRSGNSPSPVGQSPPWPPPASPPGDHYHVSSPSRQTPWTSTLFSPTRASLLWRPDLSTDYQRARFPHLTAEASGPAYSAWPPAPPASLS